MFNTNNRGKPIARIVGGDDNDKIIYLDDKETKVKGKLNNAFEKVEVMDGVFSVVPDTTRERDCIMITGASGSGKSYWTNNYMKEYKKCYKKNPIYFFSKYCIIYVEI